MDFNIVLSAALIRACYVCVCLIKNASFGHYGIKDCYSLKRENVYCLVLFFFFLNNFNTELSL